jgi:hypothetical protein
LSAASRLFSKTPNFAMTKRVQFDLSESKSFRKPQSEPFFLQQKPLKSILKVRKGKYPNPLRRRLKAKRKRPTLLRSKTVKALGTKTDCYFRINFVTSESGKKRSKKSFRTVKPETDDSCLKRKQHQKSSDQSSSRIAIKTFSHP